MRISVVTPNYNGAKTIERTICSVLSQNYADLEYIVVDDGSTDQSRRIVERYTGLLTLVSKPNGGLPTAINAGFRRATGAIVCWLDSDNLLLPGALKTAAAAFKTAPDTSIIYGDFLHINECDRPIAVRRQIRFKHCIALYGYQTISNASVYLNRQFLEQIGFADEKIRCACDFDLFMRLAQKGPVMHLPKLMGAYRVSRNSMHVTQGDIIDADTWTIRRRYAGPMPTDAALRRRHQWYRFCAILCMALEGKIWSRVPLFKSWVVPRQLPDGTLTAIFSRACWPSGKD